MANNPKRATALGKDEQLAFISSAVPGAQRSEKELGVPASVTIAQAILESAWGQRHMGNANNYFGIKAQVKDGKVTYGDIATGYVERITKEYDKNGRPYTTVAYFRAYRNMADSILDHGVFLTGKRYRKALDAYAKSRDADEYARGIHDAGYATDPKYAQSLISLMKRYDLHQYNRPLLEARLLTARRRRRRRARRAKRSTSSRG